MLLPKKSYVIPYTIIPYCTLIRDCRVLMYYRIGAKADIFFYIWIRYIWIHYFFRYPVFQKLVNETGKWMKLDNYVCHSKILKYLCCIYSVFLSKKNRSLESWFTDAKKEGHWRVHKGCTTKWLYYAYWLHVNWLCCKLAVLYQY